MTVVTRRVPTRPMAPAGCSTAAKNTVETKRNKAPNESGRRANTVSAALRQLGFDWN